MPTQQCPQCQKIMTMDDRFCSSCGAKLPQVAAASQKSMPADAKKPQPQPTILKKVAASPPPSASSVSPDPSVLPSSDGLVWRKHVDAWNGFSLERPSGWDVRSTHDTITVCQDLAGLTSAMIRPVQLQQSMSADALARQLVRMMRASNATFTAWQMNTQDATYREMHHGVTTDQVLLRARFTEEQQELVGVLSVMVDGYSAVVSGFQAPAAMIEKMKPVFQRILASFQTVARLPRTKFVEESEKAFTAFVPPGWQTSGKLIRTLDAGVVFQFRASGPEGKMSAEVPGHYYIFQEEAKNWLGKLIPMKYRAMSYLSGTAFLEQMIVPEMRQRYSDFRVERIMNRADLAASVVADSLQYGEWIQPKNVTAAALQCTFTENGLAYRQRMYVAVQRWPLTRIWRASIGSVVRAPLDQFAQHYATLEGITESVRPEMQWVKLQQQKAMQAAQQNLQQVVGVIQALQGQGMPQQQQMPQQQGVGMGMGMGMPQMGAGMPPAGGQGMSPQQQMAAQQAWQQAQLKQLEIMRQANQDIFKQQQAGMHRQQEAFHQQVQAFDHNVIQGYQYMHDPYSGAQYDVPIGYNNYWANGLGDVVGSNSPYSPGYNFQPLDPMEG